jgi:hypothetical protein
MGKKLTCDLSVNPCPLWHDPILRREVILPALALFVFLALLIGAVALAAHHIDNASGNVVYSDTWDHIGMIGRFLSGRLSLGELYAPYNENRPVLLNLVLLVSAKYDHLNLVHIEYLNVVFPVITLFIIMYFSRDMFDSPLHMLIVFSIIAVLMLSLGQWANLLLPINIIFYATITFSVSSILFMHRYLVRIPTHGVSPDFIVAVVLSLIALFTMSGGVITLSTNIIQIVLSHILFRRPILRDLVSYVSIACLFTAIYTYSLHQSGDGLYLAEHPIETGRFILIELGSSIVGFFDNRPALRIDTIVGALLLITYAAATAKFFKMKRLEQQSSLGIFCLLLFGLGEAALICLARLPGFGADYGASSSYATLTVISPVAALILLSAYTHGSRVFTVLAILLGGTILVFTVSADHEEMKMTEGRKQYARDLERILRQGRIEESDEQKLENDNLENIVNGNSVLKQYGLSLFSHRADGFR